MKILNNVIIKNKLITPTNFAKQKGVDRKIVYYLIKEDKIDFTEIDGVIFVVLSKKSNAYKRRKK